MWKLIWRRGERDRNITEKETKTFLWKLIWNRHRVKKWIETFLWKLVKNRIKRVCFVTPGKNPENSRKVFNSLKGSSFPFFFWLCSSIRFSFSPLVLFWFLCYPCSFLLFWFCSDDGSLKGKILILAWAYLGLVWLVFGFKLVC